MFQDTIRHEMYEISQLHKTGKINWYYFLYHGKPEDPSSAYFDVVFTTDSNNPNEFLLEHCVDTKKISPMREISGIDIEILEGQDITEAWRIIGEQSEFLVRLVRAHAENSEIHHKQIAQFMHFFMNPLSLGLISILFFPQIPPAIVSQIRLMPQSVAENYVCF
jgi:hypothetical protein